MTCGIIGYGINIPKRRIKAENVVAVWKNTDIDMLMSVFQVNERTVLNSDEDITTLAVEAARCCLKNCGVSGDDVHAVFLGTASNPDLSRATSTVVMSALTSNNNYYAADIQSAEKSGTAALIAGHAMIQSDTTRNALVIASDTKNRHIAPGDLRESYSGAGAAGVFLGTEHIIAEIDDTFSYHSNFPDEVRPEDERYIRALMPLTRDRLEHGYVKHSTGAMNGLLNKVKKTMENYDYFVAYQPYPAAPLSLAKVMSVDRKKILPSLYADLTGDIGCASALVGLSKVLDIASPGEKIMLCSYGTGAGADAVSLTVTDEILTYRRNKVSMTSLIEDQKIYVDYSEAVKYEFKYVRPDQSLNTFL